MDLTKIAKERAQKYIEAIQTAFDDTTSESEITIFTREKIDGDIQKIRRSLTYHDEGENIYGNYSEDMPRVMLFNALVLANTLLDIAELTRPERQGFEGVVGAILTRDGQSPSRIRPVQDLKNSILEHDYFCLGPLEYDYNIEQYAEILTEDLALGRTVHVGAALKAIDEMRVLLEKCKYACDSFVHTQTVNHILSVSSDGMIISLHLRRLIEVLQTSQTPDGENPFSREANQIITTAGFEDDLHAQELTFLKRLQQYAPYNHCEAEQKRRVRFFRNALKKFGDLHPLHQVSGDEQHITELENGLERIAIQIEDSLKPEGKPEAAI